MARTLTTPQRALLRSGSFKLVSLLSFFLDSGTYRFCDDAYDLTDGTDVYIGASAYAAGTDIKSGTGRAAESVTLSVDANKVPAPAGTDPAVVLRSLYNEVYHQRRVDVRLGFAPIGQQTIAFILPVYAGKINHARMIHEAGDLEGQPGATVAGLGSRLEIILDSLAARYGRATHRTRSHEDQQQIDPTDKFYSFVADATNNEKKLYWGGQATGTAGYTGSGGGGGGFGLPTLGGGLSSF